jgi:ABC-type uncharacterized transport system involved in gliding motility auxiliary subunit
MANIDRRRWAPLGLYIALMAALTAGALYIVRREFDLVLQISLAMVVVGLALFVIMDPERVRIALTGRQARHGSNAALMTVAFVGILAVVNYLAYQNPKRWDLTEEGQHSLARETLDTLQALPAKVEALAFYPPNVNTQFAQKMLSDYKFYGDGVFDYTFIDPYADPVTARQVNVPVETSGTIVFVMGDRQERVASLTEQEMTNALVRLMGEELAIYFLTGHGEHSPEDFSQEGYSQLKTALEAKNYSVAMLNLLAAPAIPNDAQAIVVAGPRKPLEEGEVQLLRDFAGGGGGLVVMLEPPLLTEFGDQPDLLAEMLAEDWGLLAGDNMVVDLSSSQGYVSYSYSYNQGHPITNRMQGLVTAYPTARTIHAGQPASDNIVPSELVYTAPFPNSWAETDLETLAFTGDAAPDDQDLLGPVPVVAASEDSTAGGRVVLFGDAEFAINATITALGNSDIIVNALDWVSEQENLISLTPKAAAQRILMPPTTVTNGLILLGAVFVPAGLVIAGGIATFVQRRRRG